MKKNSFLYLFFFHRQSFFFFLLQAIHLIPDLCVCFQSGKEVKLQGQPSAGVSRTEEPATRQHVEVQQRYVESLRQEIQDEQRRAEKELEREQAHLRRQHGESACPVLSARKSFRLRSQTTSLKNGVNVFLSSLGLFIATVQEWIVQEKQRLAAITQDSGVQADLLPVSLLERLTNQNSEGSSGQMQECPAVTVRAWKRLVQEELLRHHALCRAESRVRRKRLHYQLQRVARKRRLLEAKRELQRLEKALPTAPDSPECPESEAPATEMRGRSFSADLLSRLYPQNTPIFR